MEEFEMEEFEILKCKVEALEDSAGYFADCAKEEFNDPYGKGAQAAMALALISIADSLRAFLKLTIAMELTKAKEDENDSEDKYSA